jgi:hypothetical protein
VRAIEVFFPRRVHRKVFVRRSSAGMSAFPGSIGRDSSFSIFSFLNSSATRRNVLRAGEQGRVRGVFHPRLLIPLRSGSQSPRGDGAAAATLQSGTNEGGAINQIAASCRDSTPA